jgi:HK97 family phage portal protein
MAWNWFDWISGAGAIPNDTVGDPDTVGPDPVHPGDPDGFEFETAEPTGNRMASIAVSPWSGWPAEWATPAWDKGDTDKYNNLVDAAWGAIDLNASVLSAMPVYRTRNGKVMDSAAWMTNPDPLIYTSWAEFAKQLFWDYQTGEAFVLPMGRGADGWPMNFRVIPPWLVNVEMGNTGRVYNIGKLDVTDEILHIRYKSTTDSARGIGPLESGKYRLIAAGVLARYAAEVAQGGGIPYYWLQAEKRLSKQEAEELKDSWWRARVQNPGIPPVLSGGVTAERMQFNPSEIGLTELAQFTESRIVTMLGVPPFLMGLPSGGDSMTYSNVSSLFDFHDRASLRPKANAVMTALSGWALPRGQSVELNRDEYSRPALADRAEAYVKLNSIGALSVDEIRTMERLNGEAPRLPAQPQEDTTMGAEALTGGQT